MKLPERDDNARAQRTPCHAERLVYVTWRQSALDRASQHEQRGQHNQQQMLMSLKSMSRAIAHQNVICTLQAECLHQVPPKGGLSAEKLMMGF